MSSQGGFFDETIFLIAIGAVVVALVAFVVRDEMQWSKWSAAHCTVIGEISASSGIGFTGGGNVAVVTTPGKTGYRCDDGKEYWR